MNGVVSWPLYIVGNRQLTSRAEQKKAALRRVEMELDEADEMVRPPCTAYPQALIDLRML